MAKSISTDVIILGGGAMGCASAAMLAARGMGVRLIEQFYIGHDLGSSHGYSRIIRRAYYEHPDYVPLVERAYELWRDLEKTTGERLLTTTGIIEMGAPEGELIRGSKLSCKLHRIPHEELSAAQIRKRFPQFNVPKWMIGVWQKDGGILNVERCVTTFARRARELGALIHEGEEVLKFEATKKGVTVMTRKGRYTAAKAVVSAGAWAGKLLSDLKLPLTVQRQAMGFYKPLKREPFELGTFPLFLMELPAKNGQPGHDFYGFPFFGIDAVKVAHHQGGQAVTPETVDRAFNTEDDKLLRDFLEEYIPLAAGRLELGKICLYTNTPDRDFIIDAHPKHKNVFIAAGFSGHGFKFSSVVGEIMADLATDGKTRHQIARFGITRFSSRPISASNA